MAEQLQVLVGANIKPLKKGLQNAKQEISSFDKAANRGSRGVDKLGKSTTNAVPALTSFSQVVQDAPYGIRGVANNITQLTSQMGYLSKSAGGTKAALKAMLGTLAGPAGILLVVSLVTSAMVSFGSSMGGAKNKAKELNDEIDRVNDNFGSELKYNKAILNNLKAQGKDVSGILDTRNDILTSQISSLKVLLQQRQELLKNQIESAKMVTIWGAIGQEAGGFFKSLKTYAGFKFGLFTEELTEALGYQIDLSKYSKITAKEQKGIEETTAKINDLNAQILNLSTERLKNEKEITKEVGRQKTAFSDLGKELQTTTSGDMFGIAGSIEVTKDGIQRAFGSGIIDLTAIRSSFTGMKEVITENGAELLLQTQTLATNMQNVVNNSLGNVFSGLGQSLGEALATGGNVVGAIGSELIAGLGRFLSQMGDLLIQYGLFAKVKGKLDTAIAAGGPASIAAGVAAVAVGVALKAAGAAIGSRASQGFGGGSVGGGGSSSSGNNFNSTSYGGGFGNGGRVIFEISGDKLIGVLNNTSLGNLRVGDSDQLITTG